MKKVTDLFRKDLTDFKPYITGLSMSQISREINLPMEKIIKLDSGENPYLEKMQSKEVFKSILLYMYPDPLSTQLREALAKYTKSTTDMIACFNGSDEALDFLVRLFVSPKDEVIITSPTFPMYEFYTKLAGGKIKMVLRNSDLSINISNILKAINNKTKIVFIDTPGNPTGSIIKISDTEKILKKGIIVVCDEAYFEFCGQTAQNLLTKYPNLIIVRTLSKWAGLAALRIGYVLANPQIIEKLLAIKSPYNVTSVSQNIAIEVLKNPNKFLKELKEMINLRDEFVKQLKQFPNLKVFPTQGAYIVVQPSKDVKKLQEFLKSKGILVRLVNQPIIENSLRINICRKKEIDIVIQAFKDYYKN